MKKKEIEEEIKDIKTVDRKSLNKKILTTAD